MNWKRHLAVGTLALLFAVGSSAVAQDKDKKSSSKPSDPQIVGVVTAADQIDIDTAKLALKKTKNDQVKQFAQQMIDDHTKLQSSVNDLGKKLNVKPEPSDISKSLGSGFTLSFLPKSLTELCSFVWSSIICCANCLTWSFFVFLSASFAVSMSIWSAAVTTPTICGSEGLLLLFLSLSCATAEEPTANSNARVPTAKCLFQFMYLSPFL